MWASRHEMRHHYAYSDWWGDNGVNPTYDQDGDRTPDHIEWPTDPAYGGPFYNWTPETHGPAEFFDGWDDQVECMFHQDDWTRKSLVEEDWADEGSRWHP